MECHFFNCAEPTIEEFPTDTHITEGEGVVFKVVARGNPQPSLTWYHHNTQLTPDYSLDLLQDGSLSITSSELRHSGVYKLSVKNSKGSVEREVKLTVTSEEVKESSADKESVEIKPIPVAEFGDHVAQSHSHSNEQFKVQYKVCSWGYVLHSACAGHQHFCIINNMFALQALDSGDEHAMTVGMSEKFSKLNRFANITVCKLESS